MAKRSGITVADFERAIDEFFDEMLISRWRGSARAEEFERSRMTDCGDHYEVRIAMPKTDPDRIEVEVSGQRLSVRLPGRDRIYESAYSFAAPIDHDQAGARWSEDTLVVSLPKQKPKRIKVND
jgi:HSP20 family molecular chaperone IbpA